MSIVEDIEITSLRARNAHNQHEIQMLNAEIRNLLERAENAEADALRLHGEKMEFYEAALKLIYSETIKNVCGWYDEIEAFRKLCNVHRSEEKQP